MWALKLKMHSRTFRENIFIGKLISFAHFVFALITFYDNRRIRMRMMYYPVSGTEILGKRKSE